MLAERGTAQASGGKLTRPATVEADREEVPVLR